MASQVTDKQAATIQGVFFKKVKKVMNIDGRSSKFYYLCPFGAIGMLDMICDK